MPQKLGPLVIFMPLLVVATGHSKGNKKGGMQGRRENGKGNKMEFEERAGQGKGKK